MFAVTGPAFALHVPHRNLALLTSSISFADDGGVAVLLPPEVDDQFLGLLDIQDQIVLTASVHQSLYLLSLSERSLLSRMRPTTVMSSAYLMMWFEGDAELCVRTVVGLEHILVGETEIEPEMVCHALTDCGL